MDATTVADLLVLAELAQERRRRQDPEAERLVEARYPEFLGALDWRNIRRSCATLTGFLNGRRDCAPV